MSTVLGFAVTMTIICVVGPMLPDVSLSCDSTIFVVLCLVAYFAHQHEKRTS